MLPKVINNLILSYLEYEPAFNISQFIQCDPPKDVHINTREWKFVHEIRHKYEHNQSISPEEARKILFYRTNDYFILLHLNKNSATDFENFNTLFKHIKFLDLTNMKIDDFVFNNISDYIHKNSCLEVIKTSYIFNRTHNQIRRFCRNIRKKAINFCLLDVDGRCYHFKANHWTHKQI